MKSPIKLFVSFLSNQLHELALVEVKNYKISYTCALVLLVVGVVAKLENASHTSSFAILIAAIIAMLGARQQVGDCYSLQDNNPST